MESVVRVVRMAGEAGVVRVVRSEVRVVNREGGEGGGVVRVVRGEVRVVGVVRMVGVVRVVRGEVRVVKVVSGGGERGEGS